MMDGCTDGRFCLTSVQLFEIRGQSAFPRVAVSHDKEFCMASVGRARVVLSCEHRGELPRGSSFRCKPSLRGSPTNSARPHRSLYRSVVSQHSEGIIKFRLIRD